MTMVTPNGGVGGNNGAENNNNNSICNVELAQGTVDFEKKEKHPK
jgi:hypothetical protein